MRYTLLSDLANLIAVGAFTSDGAVIEPDVLSASGSQIVFRNPSNDAVVTLTGSNLALSPVLGALSGTVTGLEVALDGVSLGSITEIAWDFVDFNAALAAVENGSYAEIAAIFDQSAEVVIDATRATAFIDIEAVLDDIAPLLSVGITYLDSGFNANVMGGSGADTFVVRGAEESFSYLFIEATDSSDTFDLSGAGANVFLEIDYDQDYSPSFATYGLTVQIDGVADTGTIAYGDFTDTFTGVATLLSREGMSILGAVLGDSFTVTLPENGYLNLRGGESVDQYTFTIGDGAKLRLSFDFGAWDGPDRGVVVDVGSGTIEDDGFGNFEVLDVTRTTGVLEIRGSSFADALTGSALSESFLPMQGNDTILGGDGIDAVVYGLSGLSSVAVDLDAETATGLFDGTPFTDSIVGIENAKGTHGADDLRGDGGANHLEGSDGDDTLSGSGGDDLLEGGADDDLIRGNAGADTLYGGAGDDQLRGQKNADLLDGGDGTDNLKGGSGNDTMIGGDGNDFLQSGTRRDLIEGGAGRDKLIGRSFSDTLIGGAGDDRLNAGGDDDVLDGGAGNDVLKGGAGADRFVFSLGFGQDRLLDFELSEDMLEIDTALTGLDAAGIAGTLASVTGGELRIDFGDGDVLRLSGLNTTDGLEDAILLF